MSVVRVGETELADALDAVARVRTASVEADAVDPLDEAATLALAHRGLDGARLWVADDDAVDGNGGFALLRDRSLDLAVAPDARSAGLGTALATAALTGAPTGVTAWSHGDHPAAARLAARLGFEPTRRLWVMRRTAGPVEVPTIDGVTLRGYLPGDAAEVLRVNAAAFAHHPEQGAMDEADLAERMAEPWFDPAGLLVAEAGPPRHGLLGFHWTKQHSAELGEVYVVAVDSAAQGRGLGRLVTAAGLDHLAGLGVEEIELYVESDNAPAVALYERLGFSHTATHVRYARAG